MKTRTLIGTIVSGLWTLLFVWLVYAKRTTLPALELNQWGDFFAGYAAPLALLWLVLGYLQQGDELEQNTQALLAQQKELKDQVEQTKHLVEASNRQAQASEKLAALSDAERVEQRRSTRALSLMDLRLQQTHGTYESNLTLSLRNNGAPGRRVSVVPEPNHRFHLSQTDFLDTGAIFDLTLFGPLVFPVTLRFDYINKLKQEEHQVYELLGPSVLAERHDA